MKTILLFLLLLSSENVCRSADLPSDEKVMEHYNYIYLGVENEYDLDTSVYKLTENDYIVFPDYVDEDKLGYDVIRTSGFDVSEVRMNKYEGYYTDTLQLQCTVLITPKDYYASGTMWGIPNSILILYSLQHNEWKLSYVASFYHEATLIQLDPKSKVSFLYVNINYCNMGVCQWQESIYALSAKGVDELFYDISSDLSMLADYTDKAEFKERYDSGDTLGTIRLLDQFKDVDDDGVNEFIRAEDLTILKIPLIGKPKQKRYIRYYIYKLINRELILTETTRYQKLTEPY